MFVGISPIMYLPNFGSNDYVSFGLKVDGDIPFTSLGVLHGIYNVDFRFNDNKYESYGFAGGI
jgi:hypothetical protein